MSLPIYVIGHKNPDTDSICAALALAELKRQTGINATAARLGTLNPETKFILDKENNCNVRSKYNIDGFW